MVRGVNSRMLRPNFLSDGLSAGENAWVWNFMPPTLTLLRARYLLLWEAVF
jgi:hypothetical protein